MQTFVCRIVLQVRWILRSSALVHFHYFPPLHYVNCVQKWLIWLYAVFLWFDSLMIVPCGSKQVGMFSVVF
jgi:hypothetical protein